jgi:hypothetical protein
MVYKSSLNCYDKSKRILTCVTGIEEGTGNCILFQLIRIKGKKIFLVQHSKCVGCFDVYASDCDLCGCAVTINSVSTGADSSAL